MILPGLLRFCSGNWFLYSGFVAVCMNLIMLVINVGFYQISVAYFLWVFLILLF